MQKLTNWKTETKTSSRNKKKYKYQPNFTNFPENIFSMHMNFLRNFRPNNQIMWFKAFSFLKFKFNVFLILFCVLLDIL